MSAPTLARPATVPTPRPARPLTDYAELLDQIQAQGLMKRRYGYYAVKVSLLVAAFTAVWFGFFLLGHSWLQLLIAGAFALVLTHLSFLSHDAAHRQIFQSGRRNEVFASVLAGLGCGMSSVWWSKKHTRHHAAPNQIGKDPESNPPSSGSTPTRSPAPASPVSESSWPIIRVGGSSRS